MAVWFHLLFLRSGIPAYIYDTYFLRNLQELRQEQSGKHSTLIKETRELDRDYGATLERLEDLVDSVQEIKGNINSKLTMLRQVLE